MVIKNILEKLIEGKISLEEALRLIDLEIGPVNMKKHTKRTTNRNEESFLTIRMF